jgi:hypothetical protein
LIISFQEGWSTTADLGAAFFIVGFFIVVGFLVVVLFGALDLAPRDDLGRAGDFFSTAAASGAGEARGDGRGEDIA